MRTDANVIFYGIYYRFAHDDRIGCVESAGNIGRSDERKDFFIHAAFIVSKTLSKIAV